MTDCRRNRNIIAARSSLFAFPQRADGLSRMFFNRRLKAGQSLAFAAACIYNNIVNISRRL